jgi:hypothetical protein
MKLSNSYGKQCHRLPWELYYIGQSCSLLTCYKVKIVYLVLVPYRKIHFFYDFGSNSILFFHVFSDDFGSNSILFLTVFFPMKWCMYEYIEGSSHMFGDSRCRNVNSHWWPVHSWLCKQYWCFCWCPTLYDCKLLTWPLAREGALHQQTHNCLKIIKTKICYGSLTPRPTVRLTAGHNISLICCVRRQTRSFYWVWVGSTWNGDIIQFPKRF